MKQSLPSFLQAGITGTGGAYPSMNRRDLRTLCYTAARIVDGMLLGFDLPPFHSIKNFDLAVLQRSNPSGDPLVFLLMNHRAHVLACAHAHDLTFHLPFVFIDSPELTSPFEPFFHILKKHELERPWIWTERELAPSFSPQEINDIVYWKPRTVGEVIFNFWD